MYGSGKQNCQIIPESTQPDPLYLGIGIIWFVWQRCFHFMLEVLLNDFLRREEKEALVIEQMVQSRTDWTAQKII